MRIASALGLHQVVVNTYIGFRLIHHWASEINQWKTLPKASIHKKPKPISLTK